jgi:hypothetical protein
MRTALLLLTAALSPAAFAGTLSVTSPSNNDFLGRTNNVSVNITGASREVTVRVRAIGTGTGTTGTTFEFEKRFTPDSDGKANGTIPANFSEGAPQGRYDLRVTGTEQGNTYNTVVIPVTIDVAEPEFLNFNPADSTFVNGGTSGIVPIRVSVNEANIKESRVQVNSADIPNNTSTLRNFTVNWDIRNIRQDGEQSISIKVDDKAQNSTSRTVSVTIDRLRPNSNITAPARGLQILPGTNIPVAVDIRDQFTGSVDPTGIDVVARTLSGAFIARVSRRGTNNNGTTLNWFGRLRWRNNFPTEFKIVVTAVDKAGNRAVVQETRVRIRR